MRLKTVWMWGCLMAGLALAAAPVAGYAEDSGFVYVFPKFSPDPSAELVLSNLSPRLVTADIFFYDPAGGSSAVYAEIPANGQLRATPFDFSAFGIHNFDGSVVVRANGPLSAQAKLPLGSGFKTLAPSIGSRNLIIPFSQGTLGSSELSIYNDGESTASVVVIAVGSNGSAIGSAQIVVPPHATRRDLLQHAIPAILSSFSRDARDVSHLLLRVPTSVLGPERRVFALASVREFADFSEDVRQRFSDTAYVQGVPESEAAFNSTVPLFAAGEGYYTLVQVVNSSQAASSVTLTARASNGSPIGAVNPVVLPLPAGGAIRRSVQSLFRLGAGFFMGSITVESKTATVTSAALATAAGGFVVTPGVAAPSTNFAFAIDAVDSQFYTGVTFFNPGPSPALLTLHNYQDDGTALNRGSLQVEPLTSVTRNVSELLQGVENDGFIYISSDVPIFASGLYGRSDNTVLANLSPLHSQSDYNAPEPTRFVIAGTVRHNGATLPGATVQLSGPMNVAVATDGFGGYLFQNVPAGVYTVRVAANGYTVTPASIPVTITSEGSRGHDFAAALAVPFITGMQPGSVVAGSGATVLTVIGSPLLPTTEILFEGRVLPTTLTTVDLATQSVAVLKATLDAGSVTVPRVASLTIRTRGPGGSVSSTPVSFPIGSPAPVLTVFGSTPQPLLAGNPGFTTTITGSGFLNGVVVMVQDAPRPTVLLSPTTLQVVIPAEDLANGRILKITAVNTSPTTGPSNALELPVLNPTPGILSLSPNTGEVRLEANAPPIRIAVGGFGFRPGARIQFGTFDVPTQFVNSTTLNGDIPQKALQVGGALPVTVVNPAPSVAASESRPFFLVNLPPVLNSIDSGVLFFDPTRPTESFNAPIIMTGSNLGPNSVFEVTSPCKPPDPVDTDPDDDEPAPPPEPPGPKAVAATLVTSHQAILTAPIACSGTYEVRVRTPQPGGGISQSASFTVNDYFQPQAPVISSLSPTGAPAGSGSVTLTINGAFFQTGAVVSFGSSVLFPSSVTAARVVVTVPAYLLSVRDVMPVVVTNPSGGSSNRLLFTIF